MVAWRTQSIDSHETIQLDKIVKKNFRILKSNKGRQLWLSETFLCCEFSFLILVLELSDKAQGKLGGRGEGEPIALLLWKPDFIWEKAKNNPHVELSKLNSELSWGWNIGCDKADQWASQNLTRFKVWDNHSKHVTGDLKGCSGGKKKCPVFHPWLIFTIGVKC